MTSKLVAKFTEATKDKEYTLEQLNKILTKVYFEVYPLKIRKPTEYNIFVKANMSELKKQNPDKNAKELMSLVADLWKKQKTGAISEPDPVPQSIPQTPTQDQVVEEKEIKKPVKKNVKKT